MARRKMAPDMTWGGYVCPTEKSHGTLVMLPSGSYHCPHSAHTCKSAGVIEGKAFIFAQNQIVKQEKAT